MGEEHKGLAQDPEQNTRDYAEFSPLPERKIPDTVKSVVIFAVVLLLTVGSWGIARALDSKTPEYKPTETQMLRLQVKQSQAQTKKVLRDQAQAEFNAAYGALMDEANAVKKENKWPAETLVDPDKLQFSAPPKPIPNPPAVPAKK